MQRSLNIYKSIFNAFTAFERCTFGIKDKNENICTFNYATFTDFLSFRHSVFFNGIDIENYNTSKPANFFKVDIQSENTERESYRIIKNSFDSSGNKIEANKYFARELNAYRTELFTEKGNIQEKFIFFMNHRISDFGQKFIKPIIYICLLAFLFNLIKYGYDTNLLYNIYPPFNSYIAKFSSFINNIATNIIPFNNILTEGMEFMSMIFKLAFSILFWQILVAVKRQTKR